MELYLWVSKSKSLQTDKIHLKSSLKAEASNTVYSNSNCSGAYEKFLCIAPLWFNAAS